MSLQEHHLGSNNLLEIYHDVSLLSWFCTVMPLGLAVMLGSRLGCPRRETVQVLADSIFFTDHLCELSLDSP